MKSPEAPREPVIPATASDGLAPVPDAGASERAPLADGLGRGASHHVSERAGSTPARLPRPGVKGDGSTPSSVSGETNGTAGPAVKASAESGVGASLRHQLPKRRELSYRVAALAYTWAAIERRAKC